MAREKKEIGRRRRPEDLAVILDGSNPDSQDYCHRFCAWNNGCSNCRRIHSVTLNAGNGKSVRFEIGQKVITHGITDERPVGNGRRGVIKGFSKHCREQPMPEALVKFENTPCLLETHLRKLRII